MYTDVKFAIIDCSKLYIQYCNHTEDKCAVGILGVHMHPLQLPGYTYGYSYIYEWVEDSKQEDWRVDGYR